MKGCGPTELGDGWTGPENRVKRTGKRETSRHVGTVQKAHAHPVSGWCYVHARSVGLLGCSSGNES
jgi:hypothetical protein